MSLSLTLFHFDEQLRMIALSQVLDRKVTCMVFLALYELHVEALSDHRDENLHDKLGECLSEADALSSVKWKPGKSAALISAWSFRKWIGRVKPIWQELSGLLPLVAISM